MINSTSKVLGVTNAYEIDFIYAKEYPTEFMQLVLMRNMEKSVSSANIVLLRPVNIKKLLVVKDIAFAANAHTENSKNLYNIVQYAIRKKKEFVSDQKFYLLFRVLN